MEIEIPAHRLYQNANWDQFIQILRDSHINIPSEQTECKLDKMVNKLNHILNKALDIMGAAAYQLGNTSSRTITEVKQR